MKKLPFDLIITGILFLNLVSCSGERENVVKVSTPYSKFSDELIEIGLDFDALKDQFHSLHEVYEEYPAVATRWYTAIDSVDLDGQKKVFFHEFAVNHDLVTNASFTCLFDSSIFNELIDELSALYPLQKEYDSLDHNGYLKQVYVYTDSTFLYISANRVRNIRTATFLKNRQVISVHFRYLSLYQIRDFGKTPPKWLKWIKGG